MQISKEIVKEGDAPPPLEEMHLHALHVVGFLQENIILQLSSKSCIINWLTKKSSFLCPCVIEKPLKGLAIITDFDGQHGSDIKFG